MAHKKEEKTKREPGLVIMETALEIVVHGREQEKKLQPPIKPFPKIGIFPGITNPQHARTFAESVLYGGLGF